MINPSLFSILLFLAPCSVIAQEFLHPGINQSVEDLEYMRTKVSQNAQPWKDAFERMKTETDLEFEIKPIAHVMRGPYGRPNIGGADLSAGSRLAYRCALIWYITKDQAYARKTIDILNAWSGALWSFDYNDAKLLAGWTGHQLCNAAEILRYTDAGWQQNEIDSFTNMLMTVYYPLMRYYYPQANGNWDGAIIHSILAIAIFTDNRDMFNNAIQHFLYGPVNGSLFKYIYPNGQCQETMRDQAHVQLGLGEFAGAARVAYTQGLDLFSIGNNRIALGYEFTAGFLMGESPFSYGKISERAKRVRDDYEYVYRHYAAMGLSMPHTQAAADSIRPTAMESILTAFRTPGKIKPTQNGRLQPGTTGYPAGALATASYKTPENARVVAPGQSLQEALDAAAGTGRWVIAESGLHTLSETLNVPSGVTLAGRGASTKIFLDPASGMRDAMVNASDDLSNVTIRDLIVEGSVRPEPPSDPNSARSYRNPGNRGGIIFRAQREGQMKNIHLINLTVQNCTFNGVFISGASGVNVLRCDFTENGSSIVPGPALQHNLLLTHCAKVRVEDSRLDTSPRGSGVAIDQCHDVDVIRNEIARNGYYGLTIAESRDINVSENFIEGNDRSGVMMEFQYRSCERVAINNNRIQFNNGHGVESYAVRSAKVSGNQYVLNRKTDESISSERLILMK